MGAWHRSHGPSFQQQDMARVIDYISHEALWLAEEQSPDLDHT